MLHIAVSNGYRFHAITGIASPFELNLDKPLSPDKANVLRVLEQSFDYVIEALPRITSGATATHLAYSIVEGTQ